MTVPGREIDAGVSGKAIAKLRREVRQFLADEAARGTYKIGAEGFDRFSPEFSRRIASRGWIGITWPIKYGGQARSLLERYIVAEELVAAGAPVRAHWLSDQVGTLLLTDGTEAAKSKYLPKLAAAETYVCIGLSEPNAGSDLSAITTKATKVEGGWRIDGSKIWTSYAHKAHFVLLFTRTSPKSDDRHAGFSQFFVDLSLPGITIRPIPNIANAQDFNEVTFDGVIVSDDMLIGRPGDGWKQAASGLAYERSGPDRWLHTFGLVKNFAELAASEEVRQEVLGRWVANLWTVQGMSLSIAEKCSRGLTPHFEAAIVKDLGTNFEQQIPQDARLLVSESTREGLSASDGEFNSMLKHCLLYSPSFTIRGGAREILRGIIAREIGLR